MVNVEREVILGEVFEELEEYIPYTRLELISVNLYRWENPIPYTPVGKSKQVKLYRNNASGRNLTGRRLYELSLYGGSRRERPLGFGNDSR